MLNYNVTKTLYCMALYLVLFLNLSVVFTMSPGKNIRHLEIRSGKYISVSPFTGKKVKPLYCLQSFTAL